MNPFGRRGGIHSAKTVVAFIKESEGASISSGTEVDKVIAIIIIELYW